MSKLIVVRHVGNIGNRMFQYMFSRHLQTFVPGSTVVGYSIPGWGLDSPASVDIDGETLLVEGGHEFNVGRIAYQLRNEIFNRVVLRVFAQRLEYLPDVDIARAWFAASSAEFHSASRHEILINIRGAEILSGLHADYMPLQLDYYRKLIDHTGLSPVFMGQIDDGPYGRALRTEFGKARFLPSISPLIDFTTIRNAVNICCSVSTFSWLAAWMSPRAETIHLPLAGIFNPQQRRDVDLIPLSDARFRYWQFPVRRWAATIEQIRHVTEGRDESEYRTSDEVRITLRQLGSSSAAAGP
jgi:hypothetical protein